jgi:hypothetical protein
MLAERAATADTNWMRSPPGASIERNLGVEEITAAVLRGGIRA